MEDLGVARGYIDLDLGKFTSSVASAVSELNKIDQASKKTESEIAVLQSTSTKTGSAFEEAAKQAASLTGKLEAAKSKVAVYEKEIATLKTQLSEGKTAQEQLAKTIEATKKRYADAKAAVAELEKKYKSSKEAIAAIKSTHEKNNAALKTAKKEMAAYTSEIKTMEKQQAALAKEQERTQEAIKKAQDAYVAEKKTIQELEAALDKAKKTRLDMIAQHGKESEEVKKAEAEIVKYKEQLADANAALQKHAEEIRAGKAAIEESKSKYAELGSAIEDAKTAYKETGDTAQAAYDASAKALKEAKDETSGYASQLSQAKDTARNYAHEVSDLETKQAELNNEMQKAGDRLEEFQTDCNHAKADVNRLSIELANVKSSARQFGQFLEDAGGKLQTFGTKLSGIGNKITTHVTTPLVAAGTAAVKMAGDVETSFAKVETIADTTKVSMRELEAGIREVSDTTGTAQTQLNDALYQWISATADTEHGIQAVSAANKLAIGGFTDTEAAVDLLTTVLNTYGMALSDVDHVTDELLATQNYGKTTVGELATTLGAVVPTAQAAGVSFEELLTDLAILTRNGLSTDQAVTALRGALNSMIDPSTDAAKAAAALGIDWSAAALQSKGFSGMMAELQDALNNTEPKYAELSAEMGRYNAAIQANTDTVTSNEAEIERLENANADLKVQMRQVEDTAGKSSDAYKALKRQIEDNKTAISRMTKENNKLKKETDGLKKSASGLSEQMDVLTNAAESPISVFAELFGNVRGLTAALSLGNNLEEYATGWDVITNSVGAADKAFNTMQSTSAAKLQRSVNRLKNTAVDAGEKIAPVVADIVDKVADIVGKFSELDEAEQKQILKIGAVVAAAGPALKIAGTATSTLGGIITGVGKFIKSASTVTKITGEAAAGIEGITGAAETTSAVLGTNGLSGVLGALATPGVGYAVAAAAAIAAIGGACVYAHDQAIKADLANDFGTIELSAEEAMEVARQITDAPWVVTLEAHNSAVEDLKASEAELKSTVEDLNKAEWMILNPHIELTEEQKTAYKTDIETYVAKTQEWLNDHHWVTTLAIRTINGEGSEHEAFSDEVYSGLESELKTLGDDLAALVNGSFGDGLLDEETTAQLIIEKRAQIQAIYDKISDAEYTLQMKRIVVSADNDLTVKSFNKIAQDVSDLMKSRLEDAENGKWKAMLMYQVQLKDGEIDQAQFDAALRDQTQKAMDNVGTIMLQGLNYEIETIEGHYDNATRETAEQFVGDLTDTFSRELERAQNGEITFDAFFTYMDGEIAAGYDGLTQAEKEKVRILLDALKPQKEQLQAIADECIAAGEVPPKSVSEGLRNIELMEALVGDVDSGYAMIADRAASSPELQRAIVQYMRSGGILPTELMDALQARYPDVYAAAMGMDDELAQGITNGTRTVTRSAEATAQKAVNAAHSTVNRAQPAVIQVKTQNPTTVLGNLVNTIRRFLSTLKITLPIGFSTSGSRLNGYSGGGIVTQAQVATIAEGNRPEAVIPLDTSQRSNALRLWEQVGSMIGAENALYKSKGGSSAGDLADRIASKLESVFRAAPVQTNVEMEMTDGDVYMDAEVVGRKVAPTVSRVQAKRI